MSQIRKLQSGGNTPRTYNLILDGQTFTVNDDQVKQINDQIAQLSPRHRTYLGNISGAITSGEFVGNRAENTISASALTGLNDKEIKFLKDKKATRWEALTDSNTYKAKEAINEALNIIFRVVSLPKSESSKTKIEKSDITLDFNENDGKRYLSPTAESNINARKRISDLFAHLQAGDSSNYDYGAYNTDAISSWLNGLDGEDKYEAGNAYFDNLWTAMSNPGYKYDPDVDDLLKMFGITYNVSNPTPASTQATVATQPQIPIDDSLKVGSRISINGKDYNVTGFTDDKSPIVEEIINPVAEESGSTELESEQNPLLDGSSANEVVTENNAGVWTPETIEYEAPMNGIGPMSGLVYHPTKKTMELMEVGKVTLPFSRWGNFGSVQQRIMKDVNGNLFSIGEDGIICSIKPNYVNDILAGKPITYNDWHKNTKLVVRTRKQGGTISKSKIDAFKRNPIVKGRVGLQMPILPAYKYDPNWKPTELFTETYKSPGTWEDYISKYKVTPTQTTTTVSTATPSIEPADVNQDNPQAGGYHKEIQDKMKYALPLISLGRFALTSHFQNKYYRQAVAALNAGRVDKLPTVLNTPRGDNPALDRALQQVQLERMAGIKPVTSDVVANNALWNQREGQLWNRERDIIGQRSAFDWDVKNRILEIENQNLANRVATANDNAMRRAAVNSAVKQQAMELTQRRAQSWENLGLEFQNNIKSDINVINDYNQRQEIKRQADIFNSRLDSIFPGARAKYNGLSDEESAKYNDFEDYVRKNYPTEWSANIDTITKWQNESSDNIRNWLYSHRLNYSYSPFWTGRRSPLSAKKGGSLRGSTRYTMEPDERIWVENNKATHRAIAKLSENTIKLLLRALK